MSSPIPEDWSQAPLHEISERIRITVQDDPEHILTISSTSGWVDQRKKWARNMAGESLKKYTHLYRGEFSYNRGNSKTFPYGCVFKLTGWDNAAVPNIYHSFRVDAEKVNPDFVLHSFHGGRLDSQLRTIITSSARANGLLNITAGDFFGIELALPPLPEQQKIAQILTSVDEVIEKTQAQIDKLKDLKTAMMHELLTKGIGHVEFKDSPVGRIPVGWEVRDFASVVKESNQGVNTTTEKVTYSESGITAIRSNNVEENRLDMRNKKFVSREMYNRLTDKVKPRLNDVLYCNIGSKLGAAAVVTTDDEMLITWNVLRVSVKETSLVPKYFSYLLNSNRKGLRGVATESTMPFISSKVLSKYEFIVPPIGEQNLIVSILETVDRKCLLADGKLSALKNTKKALMQDLLTGKVRVNTEQSTSSLTVG